MKNKENSVPDKVKSISPCGQFCYSSIVQERLIPKLKKGAEKGRLELTGDDCEKLLFVLRTSVPLEPFLASFVDIIGSTFDDFYRRTDGS